MRYGVSKVEVTSPDIPRSNNPKVYLRMNDRIKMGNRLVQRSVVLNEDSDRRLFGWCGDRGEADNRCGAENAMLRGKEQGEWNPERMNGFRKSERIATARE
jgi:hypothetical protein